MKAGSQLCTNVNDIGFTAKAPEPAKIPDSPPRSPASNGALDDDIMAQNRLKMAQKFGSPTPKKPKVEKQ